MSPSLVPHLLDVGSSLSDDVLVELLEDGDQEGVAVLHLAEPQGGRRHESQLYQAPL